jgi:hypothetical protein
MAPHQRRTQRTRPLSGSPSRCSPGRTSSDRCRRRTPFGPCSAADPQCIGYTHRSHPLSLLRSLTPPLTRPRASLCPLLLPSRCVRHLLEAMPPAGQPSHEQEHRQQQQHLQPAALAEFPKEHQLASYSGKWNEGGAPDGLKSPTSLNNSSATPPRVGTGPLTAVLWLCCPFGRQSLLLVLAPTPAPDQQQKGPAGTYHPRGHPNHTCEQPNQIARSMGSSGLQLRHPHSLGTA